MLAAANGGAGVRGDGTGTFAGAAMGDVTVGLREGETAGNATAGDGVAAPAGGAERAGGDGEGSDSGAEATGCPRPGLTIKLCPGYMM